MANVASSANEDALSGVIRWEVDKDSISKNKIYSPSIEVGGMLWAMRAMCVRKSFDDEHLAVFLTQKDGDYNWRSVDVARTVKMINHEDDSKTVNYATITKNFTKKECSWGIDKFHSWESTIDEEKGFIKDNKLTLQVEFSLSNIIGFCKLHRINFTDPNETHNDILLVMNGEKIYVSKQYLSIHSPVFHKMFFGEFAEKDKTEIELKDIECKEFIEILNVIYPPHKKIRDDNFESLLRLGDRFEINVVINQCENFLVNSSKFTVPGKLSLAGRYRLVDLLDHCLDKLKSAKDIWNLKKSECYKEFTDEIHLALHHKMMNFSD